MALGSSRNSSQRVRVHGTPKPRIRSIHRDQAAGLMLEALEPRAMLAQLIGIQPNAGELLEDGQILNVAPTSLTFRFDETLPPLDPDTIADSITLTRSGDGVLGNANDVQIIPGFAGPGESATEAVVRFAETLPDDVYRLDAYGQQLDFTLDLGAQVIAVVPQPIVRVGNQLQQAPDQIVVYFNDDQLNADSAEDPRFYQLIFTADTATNTDNGPRHLPIAVEYDAAGNRATLTFEAALDDLSTGPGTYRLRIGTDEQAPAPPVSVDVRIDPGSSFDTAYDVGDLDSSQIISSTIADADDYPLEYAGGNDDPGHRHLPFESENQHISDFVTLDGQHIPTTDEVPGISKIGFVFRDVYGEDPFGVPLRNLITEAQRQRTREIFQLYSQYIGAQFFEADESVLLDLANAGIPYFSIVTGDLRAINPTVPTGPGGVIGLAGAVIDPVLGIVPTAIMDNAESWEDSFGGSWFETAMHEIGHLLGLGHTYDLPPGTIMGNFNEPGYNPEPYFPGDHDIVHAQHLHRPEGRDIDMYRFDVDSSGLFTVESFAERRLTYSFLDTVVSLYRDDGAGNRTLLARNDNYFSNDSFIEMFLEPGTYYVGVSAAGNDDYNPAVEDSGLNGRSEGDYEIRLNFRPEVTNTIVDTAFVPLDGNADGTPGGVYNFWFRAQDPSQTIIVDKAAGDGGDGSLNSPYNNIAVALAASGSGDVVRIVGNGGLDGDLGTLDDNAPYRLGFNRLNQPLADGATMQIPAGVTVMIDEGAIFKLRRARIGVGSSAPNIDRSASALQVLGTPDHDVIFTSINDESIGIDFDPLPNVPSPGDWGGLVFRSDVDRAEQRFVYEREGIFLNYVNHADLRYGGGEVVIESIQQVVTPIQMIEARPTITFNSVTQSADAAISADPNSFEETNFHAPEYQTVPYTSDYTRIGPEIHQNVLLDNSINGLFIRIRTPAGNDLKSMTVSGRWDDTDVVHVVSENLVIEGTPGGPLQNDSRAPDITSMTVFPQLAGTLNSGFYSYKITFVRADGTETTPSAATFPVQVLGRGVQGSVQLSNLPLTFDQEMVARRIYRSASSGLGPYTLVAEQPLAVATFLDDGTINNGRILNEESLDLTANLDARLMIDPAVVVKLDGSYVDVAMGGQLIAEGLDGFEVVMTSILDDRYGAAGTFDTSNDGDSSQPAPGDWAGLFVGHTSDASIDFGFVAFGGGVTKVEGSFTAFNALEIHQADSARVTHSTFVSNANGLGGQAPPNRFGRGFNASGTIFIRGAQPIIVDNVVRGNEGAALNANPAALNSLLVNDHGRSTGLVDQFTQFGGNQGPLIRANRLGENAVNGMVVRGEVLNTQSVWDDTDIVHVVYDEIVSPDFHSYGGLRLESSASASLVVKLDGENAGFTANGRPIDTRDRIGGAVQLIGQPGFPVVLTALRDDSIGAGFDPEGRVQNDTDGNGSAFDPGGSLPTGPEVNNGTLIDNDVPFGVPGFFEADPANGGELNVTGVTVQTQAGILQRQNYIAQFINYVDVGRDGGAFNLGTTNITLPPTLIANDVVASEGNFIVGQAPNEQTINWRVETSFRDGDPTVYNEVTFSSDLALGSLRLINYLDPAIFGAAGDILFTRGTPGDNDFRAYIVDDAQRVGFGHGGVLEESLSSNMTFSGWASDIAVDLNAAIVGPGAAYSVAGTIDVVSLPQLIDPDLGVVYGPEDVTTAFAWDVDGGALTATATSLVQLLSRNPSSFAGDWRGIRLEEFGGDRNVDIATEREPISVVSPGVNALPSSAQFLGELAPYEKGGDDNRRLGFEVHGFLADPKDIDVYSFRADGGTEVWLDLDRTSSSLDSVIELIDANGLVIARSDDSYNEQVGFDEIVGPAQSLDRSVFNSKDRYSVNLQDAGMRIILPGAVGTTNTYHVRVRSSGPDVATDISGGVTSGAYQLQVRLRELDEIPGSSIQFADIRNAVTAIEINGQPSHSPLLGDVTEVDGDNQTRGNAQNIGNILSSNRGGVTLTGSITDIDDIDWYEFQVQLEGIQRIAGGVGAAPIYAAVTFDVDFTDGLARPNTKIHIFNDAGELVYSSDDSSIPDDRPAISGQDALTDLSTGSAGSKDPYLGTVELQEGTYYMAVTTPSYVPSEPGSNPNLRTEPVNSLVRVAEDRVGFSGGSTIPNGPIVPILFSEAFSLVAPSGPNARDGETFTITDQFGDAVTYEFDNDNSVRGLNVPIPFDDDPLFGDTETTLAFTISQAITANGPAGVTLGINPTLIIGDLPLDGVVGVKQKSAPGTATPSLYVSRPSNVPYYLGDVTLFVSQDAGLDQSLLLAVDPYTGGEENIIGRYNANVHDIAIRPDGNIYGYTVPEQNPSDANSGNYHLIDPQSLATQDLSTNVGDDGIQTFQDDPMNPGTIINANDGVQFEGITFGQIGQPLRGFAIGNRGFLFPNGVQGPTTNLLYEFDVDSGAAFSLGPPPDPPDRVDADRLMGGGTQIRERGQLDTTTDPIGLGNTALLTIAATEIDTNGNTIARITDGLQFTIDDGTGLIYSFEFNSGPEVRYTYSPANGVFVRDGDNFFLDGSSYEFDTGSVIVVNALNGNGVADGETITISDDQIPTVTRTFEFDDGSGGPLGPGNVRIPFNSGMDQATLINTIIGSINAVGNFNVAASLLPNSNRISLRGESGTQGAVSTSTGIAIQGAPGGVGNLVRVEENSTFTEFGQQVASDVPGASVAGNRINFPGFIIGNFGPIANRGVFQANPAADGTVSPAFIGVSFGAGDTQLDINNRVVQAINSNTPLVAMATGASVTVPPPAFVATADLPLRIGGTAPGGNFTGLAIINQVLYGVTGPDAFGQGGGGLFRILGPRTNNAVADYIETSSELLTAGRDFLGNPTGGPIEFAALQAGPDNLEDGRFADMLFGMDVWGNLYAFDLQGQLQPVFMNSQSSVATGLFGVNGFSFGTLDMNLWHVTDNRRADAGHGFNEAPDGSRRAENTNGNTSLYFGFEDPNRQPGNWGGVNDPGNRFNYDFPGGAHGTIVSNIFSLKDYDSTDRPTLYFNYFLDTEQAQGDVAPPPFMRDSVRVFISDDDGEWQLMATNNSFRGNGAADDEFDYEPFDVQELFDNSGWLQARIDLSPYGGRDNLRLRFDFSTAGSFNIGDNFLGVGLFNSTGGDELRAIDASRIVDGDSILLQDLVNFGGLDTFEFDLGYTINAPTGAGLVDGETLTLNDGVNPPVTLELDLGNGVVDGNIPIVFHEGMSAFEVAQSIEDSVLLGFGKGIQNRDMRQEQNDTISQPIRSSLTAGFIKADGTIGDNPTLFGPQAGRDVDMLEIQLEAGQQVLIDLDTTADFTSLSNSYLRLFDVDGTELATSDNDAAPGEPPFTLDSYIDFTAAEAGLYYVGVSGVANQSYSPFVAGSGVAGATGDYQLTVHLVAPDSDVETHLNGSRLNLQGVVGVAQPAGASLVIDGAPGTFGNPIPIHSDMSASEVALEVRRAIATAYGSGDPAGIPGYDNVFRIHGASVIDPGPLGLSVTGFFDDLDPLLQFDFNGLDGDLFGAFNASTQGDGSTNNNFPGYLRGRDNAFEGVYIDDIVIGFRERGEMYTDADGTDTFDRVPLMDIPAEEIIVGDYSIEMRSSPFYGLRDPQPIPTLILTDAFDPRDRLAPAVHMISPAGYEVADGMTFIVGDGTNEAILEYDDPTLRNGVVPGHFPIVFSPMDTHAILANQITTVINSPAVQALIDVRAESRSGSDRIDLFGDPVVKTGDDIDEDRLVESNDTLSEAIETLIRPLGNKRYVGLGEIGDNPAIGAGLDVDIVRVELAVGDRISADVDSLELPVDTMLRLFDADGNQLVISDDDPAPGESASREPYLEYTATVAGEYFVGVSGFSNSSYDPNVIASGISGAVGPYRLEIFVGGNKSPVQVFENERFGDQNVVRDQGQIIVHSTRIKNSSEYGIVVDSGLREPPGNFAHQGPPRLLFEDNPERLARGVTIKNNVIAYNGVGAIRYSGDPRPAGQPDSAVPFGRIVNNTLVGGRPAPLPELLENSPLGVGVQIDENASPTLLNNIIVNFGIGIDVDATSQSTVIGGSLYQNNIANSNAGLGDFPILLQPDDELFVDRDKGNFNLAEGSLAIDSSIDSLRDRPAIVFVSEPLGVPVSPILAPEMDNTGQLRVDDPFVDTPAGLGDNVFKDRGAIDRADFVGPTASLIAPADNGSGDLNPANGIVQVNNPSIRAFEIQLNDGLNETQRQAGTGVDADTVVSAAFEVFRNGVLLTDGVDYTFSYDRTSRVVRLTALSGVWQPGRVYDIEIDNSEATGIRDLANNLLEPNEPLGGTHFTISIGGEEQDFGDAPLGFPVVLLDNGASHVIESGFYLGFSVDAEPDGQPSSNADADVPDEDGVVFLDPMVPGSTARIEVRASRPGRVDAWIDFGRDGSWNQLIDRIWTSQNVAAGINVFNVSIPESSLTGATFARFRLSHEGGLPPTGLALNGEVEDYLVDIVSERPWHNEDDPLDVNGDGIIIPMDALLVINELNTRKASDPVTGLLDNPPIDPNTPDALGFVDVDGDGFAIPRDVLLVINRLNNPLAAAPATALAEAESDDVSIELDTPDQFRVLAGAALVDAIVPSRELTTRAIDEVVKIESCSRVQTLEPTEIVEVFDDPRTVDDLINDSLDEIGASVLLSDDDSDFGWGDLI